jgi:hypothetical protein
MTTPEVQLSPDEWDKAMKLVLAAKDDPEDAPSTKKGKKPVTRKRPPYVLPTAKAGVNMGDAGDTWTALQPPAGKNSSYMEDGPERTPGQVSVPDPTASTTTPDRWVPKVGVPQSTGKPSGSMALNEDDTAAGWSSNIGKPEGTVYNSGSTPTKIWTAFPSGTPDPNQNPDGPTTVDKTNKTPRTSLASVEDLYTTPGGNASLPDGSFFIATADDVKNCVDKVKNADQTNPQKDVNPWFHDIKGHIARRAADLGVSDLVPPDWNISMGMRAEAEIAKLYSVTERKAMAKQGLALPDGSYPIKTAADLQNAAILARTGHGNVAAAKAHIAKRAKALGIPVPAGL